MNSLRKVSKTLNSELQEKRKCSNNIYEKSKHISNLFSGSDNLNRFNFSSYSGNKSIGIYAYKFYDSVWIGEISEDLYNNSMGNETLKEYENNNENWR